MTDQIFCSQCTFLIVGERLMRNWILTDLCDDSLMEAVERNIIEHMLFFASRHPKMDIVMQDDFILVDTNIRSHFFNYVCTTRFVPEDVENRIKRSLNYFKERGLPFSWLLGPTTPVEVFGRVLENLGLSRQEQSYCMTLNLHNFKKKLKYIPGFRVQQALTKLTIKDVGKIYSTLREEQEAVLEYFEKVSALAFHGSDPIRLFVGYYYDKPAVVGELYLGAGIAGLRCSIAKDFIANEKDFVTDLVTKMLLQAKDQGYHWAMIKTFKENCHYFNQIGFKKYCEYCRYQ